MISGLWISACANNIFFFCPLEKLFGDLLRKLHIFKDLSLLMAYCLASFRDKPESMVIHCKYLTADNLSGKRAFSGI
jgi:hypothetical protein